MVLEVHVAFLFAALMVLFGLSYTISQFLNYKIEQAKAAKELADSEAGETGFLTS